jgi:PAS domain S-box-containing protein
MPAPFGTQPLGGLSPEELLLALEAANVGTFRLDLRTRELRWSPSLAALHGITPEQAPETFEDFLSLVHPDDRQDLAARVRATLDQGVPYAIRLRFLWPDGTVHWMQAAGRRVDDVEGRPSALVGVARDVDREHRALIAGDEMRALVDAVYATAPVGLFVDTESSPSAAGCCSASRRTRGRATARSSSPRSRPGARWATTSRCSSCG